MNPPPQEMLGAHDADGVLIALDRRQAGARVLVVEIDRGYLGLQDQLGELGELGGDDAIAVPLAQPGRHGVLERSGLEEDGPGAVLRT